MRLAQFFIIFGWPTKLKTIGISHPDECPHCQNETWVAFTKERQWLTLFYIPIIPISSKSYYLICTICGANREVDKNNVAIFKDLVARTKQSNRGDMSNDQYRIVLEEKISEFKNEWGTEKIENNKDENLPEINPDTCSECGTNIPPHYNTCPKCDWKEEVQESIPD